MNSTAIPSFVMQASNEACDEGEQFVLVFNALCDYYTQERY